MLSITKCKKILNKNGILYTDDEVLTIRNILFKFAEVAHSIIDKERHLSSISDKQKSSDAITSNCSRNKNN